MKSRRKAREAILQALYSCDTLNDWSVANLDLYLARYQPELFAEATPEMLDNAEFAKAQIAGIFKNIKEIDGFLSKASLNWSVARMSRVDRNILRLAIYEIAFCLQIPVNVSINEAIEIAKNFSSVESSTFINGVLDKIAGLVRPAASEDPEELLKKAI